jgi:lactoylglutathione lyase
MAMLPIRGVYEVAVRVKDLAKAEPFYRDVLGLDIGLRDEKRNWLFLRAGGDAGMVVLQEDKGDWPLQHFAFTVDEADIERAAAMLRERGVEVEGPVVHQWMGATSLYFKDPDGHALELCANSKREDG